MHMGMSQEPLYMSICGKNAAPQDRDTLFARACAIEMRTDISQEPSYARIAGKKFLRQDRDAQFCASLRNRNAHGTCHKSHPMRRFNLYQPAQTDMHRDLLQESLYARIYRKNATPQDRDAQFVRACAIEMHMDIPQKSLQEKCRARQVSRTFCASLRSRHALGQRARAIS